MKRYIIILFLLSFVSVACSFQEKKKTASYQDSSKILIAYFSWADNTVVTNEEESINSALRHYESVGDHGKYVDVKSSASIIQPGNVEKMATCIQEMIGGDLFSIQVKQSYPSHYDECLERASNEKTQNARPQLKNKVKNINDYDTVFIGYPNWWATVPMAVLTFIDENDLSNKNVILFSSHGTGGLGRSVKDIQSTLPSSVHLEDNVVGIYRDDIENVESIIKQWLKEIGYQTKENK